MKRSAWMFLVWVAAVPVRASIVIDGTRDVDYGAPIVVQTVQTQFGDSSAVDGSELDAAYGVVHGGRLYLLLTGNLQPNFNRLEVFIDSKSGGENTLTNTPQYDEHEGGGWLSQNLGGLTFDTAFLADYHLIARWSALGTGPMMIDFVDRQGGAAAMVPGSTGQSPAGVGLKAAGSIAAGNVGPNASATALTRSLFFAIDNNNIAGVTGGSAAANGAAAAAVTTGMEFSIALADLGNPAPGHSIKIVAAINNADHNYLSNQVLAGLPAPQINLGGDGAGGFTGTVSGVDLRDFTGSQFFTIPVPAETADELFLSEYVEGATVNRAIEIHNATGATIDLGLGSYTITTHFNGAIPAAGTVELTGTLADGDTFVIAYSAASDGVLAVADLISDDLVFTGNDVVALRQGGLVIDAIGQLGNDPGTQWGTGLISTTDNTLQREDRACRGDLDVTNVYNPAPEWIGFATDTLGGLGSHTEACDNCGPGGFDVDLDGEIGPLTDGVLILRALFGFSGTVLTQNALGPGAARTDPGIITTYLKCLRAWLLDPDANGDNAPLTDGLLLLRYFFGFRDATLVTGAVGLGCDRCDATTIEPFIGSRP